MTTSNTPPGSIGIPKDKLRKIQRQSKNVNNVVDFPKDKIVRVHTKEGFNEKLVEHKVLFVNFLVDKHMKVLFNQLSAEGVDTESQGFFVDYVFVIEAMKAALYRAYNLPHPMQKLMEENFQAVLARKQRAEAAKLEQPEATPPEAPKTKKKAPQANT